MEYTRYNWKEYKEMLEKSERIDRYNKLIELSKEFRDFPLTQEEIKIINDQLK